MINFIIILYFFIFVLISTYFLLKSIIILTRKIFIHGSSQSQREVTRLFSSWSHASWWNERSASAPWSRRRPKRATLFLFLSIHIIDIVDYSKQVTLYYTHLAGVVTGETFLFLASVTTLSKKVCVIHMVIFCYNLQCHYYEYSNKKKWFKHPIM